MKSLPHHPIPRFKRNIQLRQSLAACVVGLGVLLGLTPTPAYAIGDQAPLDINHFSPAQGTGKLVTIDLGQVGSTADDAPTKGQRTEIAGQLFLHYGYRPLVFTLGGNHVVDDYKTGGVRVLPDIVKHRLMADIGFSVALWRRFQIAISLPVTIYETGETVDPMDLPDGTSGLPPLAVAGQGDLHLFLKGVLLDTSLWDKRRNLNFGIAVLGDLAVPTGNANSFMGSSLPTFNLRLIGSMSYKRFTLALNFGGIFEKTESLFTSAQIANDPSKGIGFGVQTGHGLTFGVGAQVELVKKPSASLFFLAEVFGTTHYPFQNLRQTPAELNGAFKLALRNGWNFFLGGGPGLNSGYGVPDGRVYLGAQYAWHQKQEPPPPPPPPPPLPVDLCPNLGLDKKPKTIYTTVPAGFTKVGNQCLAIVCRGMTQPDGNPYITPPIGFVAMTDGTCKQVVCSNMRAKNGAPLVDVPEGYTQVPGGQCLAIVCKGMTQPDGIPYTKVPDDYKQMSDGTCKKFICKDAPGGPYTDNPPPGWMIDGNGVCVKVPPAPPPTEEFKASGVIYFDFNKDTVKPVSYAVLDNMVGQILAHPGVTKVRIDGHTDHKGSYEYNIDLSRRRAYQVFLYLTGQIFGTKPYQSKFSGGKSFIDPSRLDWVGFGFTCPIKVSKNKAGKEYFTNKDRQINRRVEFTIIENNGVSSDATKNIRGCTVPPQVVTLPPPKPPAKKRHR